MITQTELRIKDLEEVLEFVEREEEYLMNIYLVKPTKRLDLKCKEIHKFKEELIKIVLHLKKCCEELKQAVKEVKEGIWNIMGKDKEKREEILMFIESKFGEKL